MCLIKLSSAALHESAYNCSRSYQAFILVHCVICLHFRNQLKIESRTHASLLYQLPPPLWILFCLRCISWQILAPFLLSVLTFSSPSLPLPPPPLSQCECQCFRWRERREGLSPLLYRDPLSASGTPLLFVSVFVCKSVFLCVVCVQYACVMEH